MAARLHGLAISIPWLLKRLQIRTLRSPSVSLVWHALAPWARNKLWLAKTDENIWTNMDEVGPWIFSIDPITIKTPNPKCRLYWCFIEFIDWRYRQSCWYLGPLLWTSAPLNFSLVHPPPPPPFPAWMNKYSVGGRGSGCVESIYVQELYSVYLTRFRTYKIAFPPQTKT